MCLELNFIDQIKIKNESFHGGKRLDNLMKIKNRYFNNYSCYNNQKYLEETIKSVIGQSFKNYEYIIIDGF